MYFVSKHLLILMSILALSSSVEIFSQDDILRKVDLENLYFLHKNDSHKNLYTVIFLGTDCPISQKYMHTVRTMANTYKDVAFYGVVPHHFSEEQIATFKKEYKIPFNLYRDKHNKIARTFNAQITPEVFLFNFEGNVLYSGAIDNWFYALGKNRKAATEFYLKDAIEAVLSNKSVTVKKTEAIGCLIEMKH